MLSGNLTQNFKMVYFCLDVEETFFQDLIKQVAVVVVIYTGENQSALRVMLVIDSLQRNINPAASVL
jgi:hypothetical protein